MHQPLSYYCDDNALRFHVLSVGEGLMILIVFPNNTVMLFDCNVTDDNQDEILTYLENNITYNNYNEEKEVPEKVIHYFVNSHRDEDHYRGLKKVNEKFPIWSIWDSGQTGATTKSTEYEYYMSLRRKLKNIDSDNLKVLVPTNIPVAEIEGVKIYCFSDKEEFTENYDNCVKIYEASAKIQHTNCIVLKIEFGGTSLLLTGDSDWKCWKEKIIPSFKYDVKSDILIASHHGSRSFFTSEDNDTIDIQKNADSTYIESIDYIDPDVIIISCGSYETYHHPNQEALKIYAEKSENEQVFDTHKYGTIVGYIDSAGNYTVVPTRFSETKRAAAVYDAKITCQYIHNGETYSVSNHAQLPIGGTLKFNLETKGGIIEPSSTLNVYWEVSNGGKGIHKSHQEIYYKRKNERDGIFSFSRDLSYEGTHLLRCHIYNKGKGDITRVFCVKGY